MTGGDALPKRGEVWWDRVDKRRPAVVVQTANVPEVESSPFWFVPLTSRLHLEGLPGNVRLDRRDTRLPKPPVANVYDVQKVLRPDFGERLGALPAARLAELADACVSSSTSEIVAWGWRLSRWDPWHRPRASRRRDAPRCRDPG